MNNIAVLTDSNSGITQKQGEKYGISVIPMPFLIDDVEYFEDVSITREEFFTKLKDGCEVKTSQPSPGIVLTKWDELLKKFDQIIYLPMSSGLSSSLQSALILAQDYQGRVQVVDNHRISCTQKQAVLEAKYLAKLGFDAFKIREILEQHRNDASIYIAVDTLEYLKKGGRITKAGATIGSVLSIKPILQIQGEKLDAYGKARGMKQAQRKMIQAIKNDMQSRFAGSKVLIKGAYTCDEKTAKQWLELLKETFPEHQISLDPLALNIACHVGHGALAVVCMKQLVEIGEIKYEL